MAIRNRPIRVSAIQWLCGTVPPYSTLTCWLLFHKKKCCSAAEGPQERQTPELQTPELQTPELQTPELQTPELHTPELQTPELQTPELQTPELQTPELHTPELQTPELQTPELQTPELQTPELQTPELQTPELQTLELQTPELQTEKDCSLNLFGVGILPMTPRVSGPPNHSSEWITPQLASTPTLGTNYGVLIG